MNKNIIMTLFLSTIIFISIFFIDIMGASADSECIRCTYSRVWYTGGSGNFDNIEETMQRRSAKIQLVIKKNGNKFSIDKTKCNNSVTSALGGGNGTDTDCSLSGIDSLNKS